MIFLATILSIVLILVIFPPGRKRSARSDGVTVALNDLTLYSERHRLVGRPDRLVKIGDAIIPEDWKSSPTPRHHHKLQLAAYMLLVEEHFHVRPPYGILVMGNGRRYRIPNSDALQRQALSVAHQIRSWRREQRIHR